MTKRPRPNEGCEAVTLQEKVEIRQLRSNEHFAHSVSHGMTWKTSAAFKEEASCMIHGSECGKPLDHRRQNSGSPPDGSATCSRQQTAFVFHHSPKLCLQITYFSSHSENRRKTSSFHPSIPLTISRSEPHPTHLGCIPEGISHPVS